MNIEGYKVAEMLIEVRKELSQRFNSASKAAFVLGTNIGFIASMAANNELSASEIANHPDLLVSQTELNRLEKGLYSV